MRGMEEIKCPAVLWFEWDWDGKLWHCCGISSFSLTRISFPLSLLQKKCTEANEHHCSKLCICGGGESVLPVTRDQRLARQLGAQTHLLLATDIADDGVGGRAGRGTEDCHHPFRHDLAHWEETQTAREKGSQAVLTSKVKYFQKRTSTARLLMAAHADHLNLWTDISLSQRFSRLKRISAYMCWRNVRKSECIRSHLICLTWCA